MTDSKKASDDKVNDLFARLAKTQTPMSPDSIDGPETEEDGIHAEKIRRAKLSQQIAQARKRTQE